MHNGSISREEKEDLGNTASKKYRPSPKTLFCVAVVVVLCCVVTLHVRRIIRTKDMQITFLRRIIRTKDTQITFLKSQLMDMKGISWQYKKGDAALASSLESTLLGYRLERDLHDLWPFLHDQLKSLLTSGNQSWHFIGPELSRIISYGTGKNRALITDLKRLQNSSTEPNRRKRKLSHLSSLIQLRIHQNQNPKDCEQAKKVLCKLDQGCGYGCSVHHTLMCLILALKMGRVAVLNQRQWKYTKDGWGKIFEPLSDTCNPTDLIATETWSADKESTASVIQFAHFMNPAYPAPTGGTYIFIPDAISEQLMRLHGAPEIWWMGQVLQYILRPQPHLQQMIDKKKQTINFKNPIVGVQIRRTDKLIWEAKPHSVEEYMKPVVEYFDLLELRGHLEERRVFLATDDPAVLDEVQKKYPGYKFIYEREVIHSAGVQRRFSLQSLYGIIMDIHLLSHCNYAVCTFSSNVCRLVYELMQNVRPDAEHDVYSVDQDYKFQALHDQRVIYAHTAATPEELDLQVGDKVRANGRNANGFTMGRNYRNNKTGIYPSYKADNIANFVKFVAFSDTSISTGQKRNTNVPAVH